MAKDLQQQIREIGLTRHVGGNYATTLALAALVILDPTNEIAFDGADLAGTLARMYAANLTNTQKAAIRTAMGAVTYADAPPGQLFTASKLGVNMKTVATAPALDVFTVPAGSGYLLKQVFARVSATSGDISVSPQWHVGISDGTGQMTAQTAAPSTLGNNNTVGNVAPQAPAVTGSTRSAVATEKVQISVDVGATGTLLTFDFYLFGIFI